MNLIAIKKITVNLLLIICGVGAIAKFYGNNILLFFSLAAVSAISIKLWNKKDDLLFYLIAAITGTSAEIFCIYFGAWSYPNPSFLGIPIWLPLVWGISFLTIKRLSENIVELKK